MHTIRYSFCNTDRPGWNFSLWAKHSRLHPFLFDSEGFRYQSWSLLLRRLQDLEPDLVEVRTLALANTRTLPVTRFDCELFGVRAAVCWRWQLRPFLALRVEPYGQNWEAIFTLRNELENTHCFLALLSTVEMAEVRHAMHSQAGHPQGMITLDDRLLPLPLALAYTGLLLLGHDYSASVIVDQYLESR